MKQEDAERALQAWASIERDELVRAAYAAGVTKHRIHTITGIARTTIDRILENSMRPMQVANLVNYLADFTGSWPRHDPLHYVARAAPMMAARFNRDDIAAQLLADPKFKALKLGTVFNTPEGRLLMEAVMSLTPLLRYQQDVELLVAALELATGKQQEAAREAVARGVAVAVGFGLLAAVLRGGAG